MLNLLEVVLICLGILFIIIGIFSYDSRFGYLLFVICFAGVLWIELHGEQKLYDSTDKELITEYNLTIGQDAVLSDGWLLFEIEDGSEYSVRSFKIQKGKPMNYDFTGTEVIIKKYKKVSSIGLIAKTKKVYTYELMPVKYKNSVN